MCRITVRIHNCLNHTHTHKLTIIHLCFTDALANLYNSLLQREYAGPIVFPNHQVERKAQRSPSLRLRFGRRSDPDMYLPAEKRWFGDVNQKPIRSPSLRLRFGRRSDPSMPLHSEFDAVMNDLAGVSSNGGITDVEDAAAFYGDEYPEDLYDAGFERIVRKPQRLRFGRSLPRIQNNIDDELEVSGIKVREIICESAYHCLKF